MNLVADPAGVALFGVAGVGIIGRVKALVDRRLVTWATPAHPALVVIELLDPDDPQPLDRGQPAQPEPLRFGEQGGQQVMAIGANRLAQSLAGGLAFGQTVRLDPGAIALRPVRSVVLDQPLRSGSRDGVKCGPHRLADQFQVVEGADCRQNVSGVGALLAACLDQAALAQVLQHDLEQVLIVFSGKQARSELTENGEVKPASSRSRLKAYFRSIRPRTASAACRSDRFSRN